METVFLFSEPELEYRVKLNLDHPFAFSAGRITLNSFSAIPSVEVGFMTRSMVYWYYFTDKISMLD